MDEKVIEKGTQVVTENTDVIVEAAAKSGKGKVALLFAAGVAAGYLFDKVVIPAVKKVFAKKEVVDVQAVEVVDQEVTDEDTEEE